LQLKTINATKNFNADAAIMTPKRQLLAQQRHAMHRSLRLVNPFFCTVHPLPIPQNPMLYNYFQSASHPKSTLPLVASAHHVIGVPWTHPT